MVVLIQNVMCLSLNKLDSLLVVGEDARGHAGAQPSCRPPCGKEEERSIIRTTCPRSHHVDPVVTCT